MPDICRRERSALRPIPAELNAVKNLTLRSAATIENVDGLIGHAIRDRPGATRRIGTPNYTTRMRVVVLAELSLTNQLLSMPSSRRSARVAGSAPASRMRKRVSLARSHSANSHRALHEKCCVDCIEMMTSRCLALREAVSRTRRERSGVKLPIGTIIVACTMPT